MFIVLLMRDMHVAMFTTQTDDYVQIAIQQKEAHAPT